MQIIDTVSSYMSPLSQFFSIRRYANPVPFSMKIFILGRHKRVQNQTQNISENKRVPYSSTVKITEKLELVIRKKR